MEYRRTLELCLPCIHVEGDRYRQPYANKNTLLWQLMNAHGKSGLPSIRGKCREKFVELKEMRWIPRQGKENGEEAKTGVPPLGKETG
ncbi:hypothetical protein G5I_10580 [Acromyrmex echinatior]|uniref:Uncharacterized protein n=1 Tax=Acromyrmex echinatior TaxID=103372 RepID=F4WX96_ACREC|nr:hypothetical protein G5I_10580 [Acromyrmex echinatior]